LNESAIPQLAQINKDRENFIPLLSGNNSVLEFMLDEIENKNPLVQTENEHYFDKNGVASSKSKLSSSQKKFRSSESLVSSGGANNGAGVVSSRSDLGQGNSTRVALGAVKSSTGSYRDLNASNSTWGISGSSIGGSMGSQALVSGTFQMANPSELSHKGSGGNIKSYKASKHLVGGEQGIAGFHVGSSIALIATSRNLWGGQHSGISTTSAVLMKQPCISLFKAVDPPPPWTPLADPSSR